MDKNRNALSAKEVALTAMMLAICIASQFLKNLSIFITGPIVNATLAMVVIIVNLPCAIALACITPVTAFFIAASPVMLAVPGIIPLIALGNIVFVTAVNFFVKPGLIKLKEKNTGVYVGAVVSSLLKGAVMGLTISLWLLPTFIPSDSPLRAKLPVFQITFSLFQAITALMGIVFVLICSYVFRGVIKDSSLRSE